MCSSLIAKSLRGGLVVVGGINLGDSIDPLHNALDVVEHAVEKGPSVVLMPVSSRKQLNDLDAVAITDHHDLGFWDVDLWIGGFAEQPLFDGPLGTTFTFVMADFGQRMQDGDRFYYLYRMPVGQRRSPAAGDQ